MVKVCGYKCYFVLIISFLLDDVHIQYKLRSVSWSASRTPINIHLGTRLLTLSFSLFCFWGRHFAPVHVILGQLSLQHLLYRIIPETNSSNFSSGACRFHYSMLLLHLHLLIAWLLYITTLMILNNLLVHGLHILSVVFQKTGLKGCIDATRCLNYFTYWPNHISWSSWNKYDPCTMCSTQ